MILYNEQQVIQLISEDEWMMRIMQDAKTLQLPDWWVCAGFVRSKIWDTLHGYTERTPLPDVDVIYFDPDHLDEQTEKALEQQLHELNPHVPWSVKNEARMHVVNHITPYTSSTDAISKFPETATALGLTLDDQDQLILTAPCGINDVLNMVLTPTPFFLETEERIKIFEQRMNKKNWKQIWPSIKVRTSLTLDH